MYAMPKVRTLMPSPSSFSGSVSKEAGIALTDTGTHDSEIAAPSEKEKDEVVDDNERKVAVAFV